MYLQVWSTKQGKDGQFWQQESEALKKKSPLVHDFRKEFNSL